MDNPFKQALREVVSFLESYQLKYVVIGGIANQIWGQARFTYDIDVKLLVPDLDYDSLKDRLLAAFPIPGRPEIPENPLIVSVKINGIIVDFLLATPGFEEQSLQRAVSGRVDDLTIWVCTPEDLIIQKAIAGRTKDWQDIEGILIEQFAKLDQNFLDDWLKQFAEVLERPALFTKYQQILKQIKASRQ